MAKPKQKFPTVFLACPFDSNMQKLIDELNLLPWKIKPANKEIKSDYLLKKIKTDLQNCHLAIFDISDWNVNVCLELGLAESEGIEYYILNNNTYKKDAPSDIKGIERIDYNWNARKKPKPLLPQLTNGIFKNQYYTAKIWNSIEHLEYPEKKFDLILKILCAFKGLRKGLSRSEIRQFSKGSNLREDDIDEAIQALINLKYFKRVQKSSQLSPNKPLYL